MSVRSGKNLVLIRYKNDLLNKVQIYRNITVMETVKDRLIKFIAYLKIGQGKFEKHCNLSNGFVSNIRDGFSTPNLSKIAIACPDLNLEWLITGEGEMLKNAKTTALAAPSDIPPLQPGEKLIPLYRNEAAAGFGSADFSIRPEDIEGYYKIKEFMNADFMLRIRGDSMYPLYRPGDTIAVREIKQINFIQWGKPHLIASRYQGLLIKRLYIGEEKGEVKAISENAELYPPFAIPMEEVTGLALVIGTVRLDNF